MHYYLKDTKKMTLAQTSRGFFRKKADMTAVPTADSHWPLTKNQS